ncbi:arylsulfatase [Microbacterium soli]|uniref:Arylsulfatase n=1 Tax=Microbacterium soli TaxID=446075 RepID=A0ABP7NC99_9MICO
MTDLNKPNVLFVVLDDLGFADLHCYGSEIRTPNIDSLADGGLRLQNFNVTAMCSPTRASLLTGRDCHEVGMGIIAEWATEHPGYQGRISRSSGLVSEILRHEGYRTMAVGKWHLMPQSDVTPVGPFDDWPLGRGFDRWFGFHGAIADEWNPELFADNHAVEEPAGGHLTEVLADRAIRMLSDHVTAGVETPFFMYLATGAVHWPHQAPQEYVDRYRGRYDCGWDEIRRQRFERQLELGIVPEGTDLPEANPGVASWDSLSDEEKRVYARMQEVYAAYVEHTDAQLGRVFDHLKAVGLMESTIVVVLSDNGASPEGGPQGAFNGRKHLVYEPEEFGVKTRNFEALGTASSYGHYPHGWAQASNTPLKWYKKDVHGGGVRAPFILHAPGLIPDSENGSVRSQYHHVSDVVPTVLELAGIEAPTNLAGIEQTPISGVSMAYCLTDPDAPERKSAQYYEMLGDRALWKEGWKAVTRHTRGDDFSADVWELYDLANDFSETHDLSGEHEALLRTMQADWLDIAEQKSVLPLDDREYERQAASIALRVRPHTRLFSTGTRLDRYHVPDVSGRRYSIGVEFADVRPDHAAPLLTIGSRFGGLALSVGPDGVLFEYLYDHEHIWELHGSLSRSDSHTLTLSHEPVGEGRGGFELTLDGAVVGVLDSVPLWPVAGLAGGMYCGRSGGSVPSTVIAPHAVFDAPGFEASISILDLEPGDAGSELRGSLAEQ